MMTPSGVTGRSARPKREAADEPAPPYGRTVAQLLWDEDEEDEEVEEDARPEGLNGVNELRCGCGGRDPELPAQAHDDRPATETTVPETFSQSP